MEEGPLAIRQAGQSTSAYGHLFYDGRELPSMDACRNKGSEPITKSINTLSKGKSLSFQMFPPLFFQIDFLFLLFIWPVESRIISSVWCVVGRKLTPADIHYVQEFPPKLWPWIRAFWNGNDPTPFLVEYATFRRNAQINDRGFTSEL